MTVLKKKKKEVFFCLVVRALQIISYLKIPYCQQLASPYILKHRTPPALSHVHSTTSVSVSWLS
ncbi:hypothetical protein AB205_0096980 [Aquarana catesbeiana]|uniref:Uncharacterized protein n=1 Tax=Aquarana catesbeiana TaxID=8400 RepID=A0A2G9QCE9_AQUCT|nr:hypothetical protein AB205_0096980 [Aquarana catesbeiana]